MIEPDHPVLSIGKQCTLLSLSRSSFYYTPKGETEINLALMRRICGGEREKALAGQASTGSSSCSTPARGRWPFQARQAGSVARSARYIDGRNIGEILAEELLARWWPNGEGGDVIDAL
jgi:putative transposase